MSINKKGFTLVEILAVIVILGVISAVVVPSIFSLIKESKEQSYDLLMSSLEETGRLYADRHKNEVEYDLDNYNYFVISLNDLYEDGLINPPIKDPRSNEIINMNKQLILTRESQTTLSVCFEDRGCFIPTQLANKLEENIVTGTSQGLHEDAINNFYYYRGLNPNNYVEFNGYLWRIVKINSDNTVKIIFEGKKEADGTIENGTIGNSPFNSTASNDYNTSLAIKTYLQNWYNANISDENKVKVTSKNFCIGKIASNGSGTPKTTFLSDECTNQTTNELAVGLLTGSEYLYGSTNANCLDTLDLECTDSNYLYKSDYNYYTITGVESTNNVWRAGMNLTSEESTSSLAVRPVINLKAGIITDRGNGTLDNPYQLKDIISLDQIKPIITLIGDSQIEIEKGTLYNDMGATATDNLDGDITDQIVRISTVNVNEIGTYNVIYIVLDRNGNKSLPVTRTINVISEVNEPVLATGMTPIKWVDGVETATTATDIDWYDYMQKKWANAKTADGSYWVWIPRYVYRISSGWHTNTAGTIDVRFSKGIDDTISGTVPLNTGTGASASNNTWTNHPAFTFGDKEVTGIWVSKFEASGATSAVDAKPNVAALCSLNVDSMFTATRNMETNARYGWGTSGLGIDTHLIKSVEWGAAAYLSKSTYGKNTEVWINNSSALITGCSGSSVSDVSYNGCENAYNTSTGGSSSTTGNIYGIYDMAGGVWEYTASYINNNHTNLTANGASLVNASSEYKDVYTVTTDDAATNYANAANKKGDALYEISNTSGGSSWYNDYSNMAATNLAFILRGAGYDNTTRSGVFGFAVDQGHAYFAYGFHVTLLVYSEQ